VWVREKEREARITAWVGMKEKEMGGRKQERRWFDLYVGVQQWVCKSGYVCRTECECKRAFKVWVCSKRKWRKEHAFNLYIWEGTHVRV
jgi:hypothetical protein